MTPSSNLALVKDRPPTPEETRFWSRLSGETAQAFHAFEHFRDLGEERSRDAAYQQHRVDCQGHELGTQGAPGRWTGWMTRWMWERRAEDYDRSLDIAKHRALSVSLADMAAAHVDRLEVVQEAGMVAVEAWAKRVKELNLDEVELGVLYGLFKDFVTALPKLAEAQREAASANESRGEETNRTVKVIVEYVD